MCLLTHEPKILKDQSPRKSVSYDYQIKKEKSNRIRNAERGENLRTLNTTTKFTFRDVPILHHSKKLPVLPHSMAQDPHCSHEATMLGCHLLSFAALDEARHPVTNWPRASFGISPQIKLCPTKVPNNKRYIKCITTIAHPSQMFSSLQITFSLCDILSQLVRLN